MIKLKNFYNCSTDMHISLGFGTLYLYPLSYIELPSYIILEFITLIVNRIFSSNIQ